LELKLENCSVNLCNECVSRVNVCVRARACGVLKETTNPNMPPVSQGMVVQVPVSLSGHTLSALSLLISVPSLIASARCRSRDGLSLGTTFMPSSSSSSPNPAMFKSRRRFLKLFGNACTTCGARSCLGAECQRVCEDPQCSSP
jgi:hypothetical protein